MATWKELHTPARPEELSGLTSGDRVSLSGVVYTARDVAHQRLVARLEAGQPLPFDLENQAPFMSDPARRRREDHRLLRIDDQQPPGCLHPGATGERFKDPIGKGPRSPQVVAAIRRYQAAYLVATGGAAALLAQCVKEAALVAYPDLGPEAIYRLEVERMPLIVAVDPQGRDLFAQDNPSKK